MDAILLLRGGLSFDRGFSTKIMLALLKTGLARKIFLTCPNYGAAVTSKTRHDFEPTLYLPELTGSQRLSLINCVAEEIKDVCVFFSP